MIGNPIIKKEVFENYLDKDSLSFTKAIPLSNMNDFIDELFYSKTFRGIFCGYPLLRYNDTYLMVWVGCSFCRRNDLSHTREYCGSYGAPLSWQNKVEVKNNLVKMYLIFLQEWKKTYYIIKGDNMSEYSVFEAFVLYFVWRVRNRTILSRKTYDIATNILKERGINIEEALEEIDFESFEKAYYE